MRASGSRVRTSRILRQAVQSFPSSSRTPPVLSSVLNKSFCSYNNKPSSSHAKCCSAHDNDNNSNNTFSKLLNRKNVVIALAGFGVLKVQCQDDKADEAKKKVNKYEKLTVEQFWDKAIDQYQPPHDCMKAGSGPKQQRKIFGDLEDVELDEFEKNKLKGLHKYWRDKDISPPLRAMTTRTIRIQSDPSQELRFLQGNEWDYEKTTKDLNEYVQWRTDPSNWPDYDEGIRTCYEKGCLYWHGRDTSFRPILIMDIGIINQCDHEDALRTLTFLMDYCVTHLLTNGKVEQWVVIVDTRGYPVWQTPFRFLQAALPLLSSKYRARMHRMYVLGISSWMASSLNSLISLGDSSAQKKIIVYDDITDDCELVKDIEPSQREQKFGGLAPIVTKFDQFAFFPQPKVDVENYFGDDADPDPFMFCPKE